MRDYRWFKILVRAMGLLLLGMSVPYLASAADYLVGSISSPNTAYSRTYVERAVTYGAGATGQALLGLYMLSGAPRFVRYCIDQAEKRCIRCDYDLTGLTGACPECGAPIGEGAAAAGQK